MNTKTLCIFSCITLALLPIHTVVAAPAGQITQTKGSVTVTSPQGTAKTVGAGEPIESGQTVSLGDDSRAVIKFQDGQIIALQSKTIFKVNSYKYDQAAPEKGESFLSLLQGGLRAVTGLIGSNHREGWKLATPTATMGIRGTDFMTVSTFLKVESGAVSATNSAGTAVVSAGQTAAITSGSALATVVPASAVPAGTFTELAAIDMAAAGGAAAGAGAAGGTIMGVPAAAVIGVGIAVGAAAAASSGNDDSTTTHH